MRFVPSNEPDTGALSIQSRPQDGVIPTSLRLPCGNRRAGWEAAAVACRFVICQSRAAGVSPGDASLPLRHICESSLLQAEHFIAKAPLLTDQVPASQRHELGTAVHRWKVGRYLRLKQVIHRPGQRKRRGRMMRSTQVSGGSALNWSPLQTRHWTDKKRMVRSAGLSKHPSAAWLSP